MIHKKYTLFLESFKDNYKSKVLQYIESKTSMKFYGYEETFHIQKEDISLEGSLFMSLEGTAIRLNWLTSDKNEIHSIDLWTSFEFDTNPNYTLNLNGNSILQVLPEVVSFITKQELIKENRDIEKELDEYKGKLSRARSQAKKDEYTNKISELEIELGQKETVTTDSSKLANEIFQLDPKMDVFKGIELATKQVAKGHSNSLLIIGQSGVGKTQTVLETLEGLGLKEDVHFFRASGDISAPGLYQTLFIHRNGLLVFDDCDGVFDTPEATNFLAAALDTYSKRVISNMKRTYYNSLGMSDEEMQNRFNDDNNKLPNKFLFTGKIIFVSNRKKESFDTKFLTRSITINVNLTRQELIDRMKEIVEKILPVKPLYKRMEAFDYLLSLIENKKAIDLLNIRSLVHSINVRCNDDNDEMVKVGSEYRPAWQMLIKQFIA